MVSSQSKMRNCQNEANFEKYLSLHIGVAISSVGACKWQCSITNQTHNLRIMPVLSETGLKRHVPKHVSDCVYAASADASHSQLSFIVDSGMPCMQARVKQQAQPALVHTPSCQGIHAMLFGISTGCQASNSTL
jgi:hypothetical protein